VVRFTNANDKPRVGVAGAVPKEPLGTADASERMRAADVSGTWIRKSVGSTTSESPEASGLHESSGLPMLVTETDIGRAHLELDKGQNDVAFNLILINPRNGNVHYVLGNVA
jgi:hypothetical protein